MVASIRGNYIINRLLILPLFTPIYPHLPNKKFKKGSGKNSLDKTPNSLYKFTGDGKLLEVLYLNLGGRVFCHFKEKRNNLFYGIGQQKIYICKIHSTIGVVENK
jgi:hypothetical protein